MRTEAPVRARTPEAGPDTSPGATRGPRAFVPWTAAALAAVGLYAASALVLFPEGHPSLPVRLLLLLAVAGVAAAVWILVARDTIAGGVAMLVVGFGAIAVTAGVVAKRVALGVTIREVLGVAAGVAGVGLVVAGWRRVLRGAGRRWVAVVVAVLGTLLVAQFVLLPAVIALDATNRARPQASGRTPADLGLAFDDIRIASEDGTRLAAWWIPSMNGAALIVLPGSGSTRDDVLDRAALLARAGYGVLVPDARGHGASEGRPMEFGWGAEHDVRAAITYALARPDVTGEIGIVGQSMGGEVAVTTAAQDRRVAALVVEGVSARTWADARLRTDAHPVSLANTWAMFGLVGLLSPAPEPIPLVDAFEAVAPRPILLISGAPANEATLGALYAGTSPSVTWWELPDTPHTGALREHPQAYAERVLGFLDDHLLES
jgi:pimeloyl-ACP methyl ester carboxylesterase